MSTIKVLIPNLINNRLVSSFLINLGFLLFHTEHFDKSIVFSWLVFENFV